MMQSSEGLVSLGNLLEEEKPASASRMRSSECDSDHFLVLSALARSLVTGESSIDICVRFK